MAERPNYAYFPPVGSTLYTISFEGGDQFGVYRYVRTDAAPPGAAYPEMYEIVTCEPVGVSAHGREAAIDAMWDVAASEGHSTLGIPIPPHRRRRAKPAT